MFLPEEFQTNLSAISSVCLNWICTQQSDISQAWEREQVQVCVKFINLLDNLVIWERKSWMPDPVVFFFLYEWIRGLSPYTQYCVTVMLSCVSMRAFCPSVYTHSPDPKPTLSLVIKVGTLPTVRKLSALSGCTGFAQSGFASWSLRPLHGVFQSAAVCTKKRTAPFPA